MQLKHKQKQFVELSKLQMTKIKGGEKKDASATAIINVDDEVA